jgi:hypothetical protein
VLGQRLAGAREYLAQVVFAGHLDLTRLRFEAAAELDRDDLGGLGADGGLSVVADAPFRREQPAARRYHARAVYTSAFAGVHLYKESFKFSARERFERFTALLYPVGRHIRVLRRLIGYRRYHAAAHREYPRAQRSAVFRRPGRLRGRGRRLGKRLVQPLFKLLEGQRAVDGVFVPPGLVLFAQAGTDEYDEYVVAEFFSQHTRVRRHRRSDRREIFQRLRTVALRQAYHRRTAGRHHALKASACEQAAVFFRDGLSAYRGLAHVEKAELLQRGRESRYPAGAERRGERRRDGRNDPAPGSYSRLNDIGVVACFLGVLRTHRQTVSAKQTVLGDYLRLPLFI